MEISCASPTALDPPDHIALAEQAGLRRRVAVRHAAAEHGRLGDARAGGRADRAIGLGPGVLVPTLRHPMANAAATANLVALAPGRVAVAFGTGFSWLPGDGLPRYSLGLHGRVHPRLSRPAARRHRRVGGRADAHAAPPRARRGAADRRADHHRGAGAQGRRASHASWPTASTSPSRCPSSRRSSPTIQSERRGANRGWSSWKCDSVMTSPTRRAIALRVRSMRRSRSRFAGVAIATGRPPALKLNRYLPPR